MCDIYSIQRHMHHLRHGKEHLHNCLVNVTCLFASVHSFDVVEVMVFQFFPFQLESICY